MYIISILYLITINTNNGLNYDADGGDRANPRRERSRLLLNKPLETNWNSLGSKSNSIGDYLQHGQLISDDNIYGLNGIGMKLSGFKRTLLRFETICYTGCDTSCDDSCENDDSCNNDACCGNDASCGCDGFFGTSCSCDSGYDCDCGYDCDAGYDCDSGCDDLCDDGCIDHYYECNFTSPLYNMEVNWDNLLYKNNDQQNEILTSIDIKQDTNSPDGSFTTSVTVKADYKVRAIMPSLFESNNVKVGFTYILDTHEFDYNGRKYIADANPCENRLGMSFQNKNFSLYWNYTYYPSDRTKLGNDNFLEYPNPNIWNLSMDKPWDAPCGQVEWQHTFTFNELTDQCGFTWVDNGDTFDLQGNFYLHGISPNALYYDPVDDTGNYIYKTLINQALRIQFLKASRITDNAQVDLYGSQIIGITQSNDESVGVDDDKTEINVRLITWVPNFIKLDNNSPLKSLLTPTGPQLLSFGVDLSTLIFNEAIPITGNDCFLNDNYRCWQFWDVLFIIDNSITCDTDELSLDTIDISTNYTFQTEFLCLNDTFYDNTSNIITTCDDFSTGINDYETTLITLDPVELDYTIRCDGTDILVNINGELVFYQDNTFTTERNTLTQPYVSSGQNGDIVYIAIEIDNIGSEYSINDTLNIESINYDILGVEVLGIYVCYGDVNNEQLMSTSDGCLENDTNIFNVRQLYMVLNDNSLNYQLLSNNDNTDSIHQFSFILPEIDDVRFWISADVILTLNDGSRRRMISTNTNNNNNNRRSLLQSDSDSSFSRFERFSSSASVTNSNNSNNKNNNGLFGNDNMLGIFIGLIIGVFILIIALIIFVCLAIKKNNFITKHEANTIETIVKSGERVKSIDSDVGTPVSNDY